MARLLLLTDARLPQLPLAADDQLVLLGKALGLLWPADTLLAEVAARGDLYALTAELVLYPVLPLAVKPLADHDQLAQLVESASAVVAGG